MSKTVTVSARIPEELKRELEKYGINEAEVIRRALMMEVKRAKARELNMELNKIDHILSKLSTREGVSSIREDRESR
ncbi:MULTISPECIES: hypothetical protein [Metallosphaera]|uniref:Transcriptional regulator, CopG family n=3 Tax=Metallosphaera TaxID=41980 RepID=A4YDL4_METS5|nr:MULTISPECIES: hypothetical protein [Metallosphaera]ABP94516.1 transcriptional regulator, CopG family [Metallosphaera sedula DSM 5348]AIM26503.1 transcriptional regulator, CopG family [Metallosphaera sedula]AKV73496.1 CopG family transcriptional regulator [Metallosphaera sedula]AKV75738.1 CopG family transcriptional regulator [Metallosphaera sedula]AKV77985.1 CopG family transcriptional regulator [Metallosphaera sedula]